MIACVCNAQDVTRDNRQAGRQAGKQAGREEKKESGLDREAKITERQESQDKRN